MKVNLRSNGIVSKQVTDYFMLGVEMKGKRFRDSNRSR